MTEGHTARMHVLIAGGGVAGLEALLALSALVPDLVDIELLTPDSEFVFRPLQVAEPFGVAEQVRLDLDHILGDTGARQTRGALVSVDPVAHEVTTSAGDRIGYEALLVAPGARPVEAVPGALTFSGGPERRRFAELLAAMGRRGARRLAFVVPPRVTWSIAAYELAFLTAAERDARRLLDVELILVTHESAPLELFGPAVSQVVAARLDEARIALRTASPCELVEGGRLRLGGDDDLEADGAVALPGLEVPEMPGLPQRKGGFVQTDVGMRVVGLESVWAAGDVTWFPVKQGGLAAQQSDVAARSIAAAAGGHVPAEAFHPALQAALITGDSPELLQAMLPSRGHAQVTAHDESWSPPAKIAARYLAPYIARALGERAGDASMSHATAGQPTDAGGRRPAVELLLAAADADAGIGDFRAALGWLWLVERLNLVIPATYVARRHEWRRQLEPGTGSDTAAGRMEPSFVSASAAISELQRRLGWLREIERRTEGEMRRHIATLDQGMSQLITLSRRAGMPKGPQRP